jgi:putative NADH-flavin reductase
MKILILGISGRTGRLVAEEALKRKHTVAGIVRNPGNLNLKGAEIIAGSPYDIETVRKAMEGCDAVISTLSLVPSSHGLFKKITTPLDSMSVSLGNTVTVMREKGIRRIVLMTAAGVGDSANMLPAFFKFLIKISKIRFSFADHERQEKILVSSDLDWTIVRPVGLNDKDNNLITLTDTDGTGKLKSMISRNAVAHFILCCIENGQFIRQMPVISNK